MTGFSRPAMLLAVAVAAAVSGLGGFTFGEHRASARLAAMPVLDTVRVPPPDTSERNQPHDDLKLGQMLSVVTTPAFATAWSDIAAHEGFRSEPYHDTEGNLTIGMGLCVQPGRCPMSRDLAEYIMRGTASDFYIAAVRRRPQIADWPAPVRVAALDAIYNLGVPHFLGFRHMLEAIDGGRWDEAAREALDSAWYRDVNTRPRAAAFAKVLRDQGRVTVAQEETP